MNDNFLAADVKQKVRAFLRAFRAWTIVPAGLMMLLLAMSGPAFAQEKYSPDDKVVQDVAEKAVKALETMGSGSSGELALGALAVVECGKRYQQSVPRNSGTVKKAIDRILADLPKNTDESDGPLAGSKEVYYPAVALILLSEFDDQKYADEIKLLIRIVTRRQLPHGGFYYNGSTDRGDTSQMQYAALALFVAKQHRFFVEPESAKAALDWLCRTQRPGGKYVYKVAHSSSAPNGKALVGLRPDPSIQSAGIGTVYLLADLLQLSKRKRAASKKGAADSSGLSLPPGVSIYVPPRDGDDKQLDKEGPLVNFDRARLGTAKRAGNEAMEGFFEIPIRKWTYYYLYAFERYAYFRDQAEGDMGRGKMKTWYDDGVYFLMNEQLASGAYPDGFANIANGYVNTSFAILFLVRSSEILVQPPADSELAGAIGFPSDTEISQVNGQIRSNTVEQGLDDMMEMLQKNDLDDSDLAVLAQSMRKAVSDFRNQQDQELGNLESFLRTMISDRNYYRRLIAVRFLAGEQNLDNVPALLYALTDPDFRIAHEAHNGLRLISRKIGSVRLSAEAVPPIVDDDEVRDRVRLEYSRIKDQWQKWFLSLRPDAKLLD